MQLCFGLRPLDELTDLATDAGHHLDDLFIRMPDFSAEKPYHTEELGSIPNGKTYRPVQALFGGNCSSGEVCIRSYVGNPSQCLIRPNTAWYPYAWREGALPGV